MTESEFRDLLKQNISGGFLFYGEEDFLKNHYRRELAKVVAFLPQNRPVPEITVKNLVLHGRFPYLSYPRRYRAEDLRIAREAMARMDLQDQEQMPVSELSGGMRQRAALIRTLAVDPDILLLDEPFSALDSQTRLIVSEDIARIIQHEEKTTLLVTHDISEAISFADTIYTLSHRPAKVKTTYRVNLTTEEPRTPLKSRKAPEFQQYFNTIWEEMMQDG